MFLIGFLLLDKLALILLKLKLVQFSTRNFILIDVLAWILWHLSPPAGNGSKSGASPGGNSAYQPKGLFLSRGGHGVPPLQILPCLTLESTHSYIAIAPRA